MSMTELIAGDPAFRLLAESERLIRIFIATHLRSIIQWDAADRPLEYC